jgi:hypothetical protein
MATAWWWMGWGDGRWSVVGVIRCTLCVGAGIDEVGEGMKGGMSGGEGRGSVAGVAAEGRGRPAQAHRNM